MKNSIAIGDRFGRLVTVSLSRRNNAAAWVCNCDCGAVKTIVAHSLFHKKIVSCGCFRAENTAKKNTTHGLRHTTTYTRWHKMVQRCKDPNDPMFFYYGARGISVCDSWLKFDNFFRDMGHPPEGLTLERIDNNLGYFPENCKWATRTEQANNKRNNHIITFNGESKTLAQWGRVTGVTGRTIYRRLHRGWSVEKALSGPIQG